MPFGLKFKRTRRYDISTKNVFMVEVQMLDNSFVECTLTSDSSGQDCLEGIAQKIELSELQYFGLRYVTKKLQFRWVDLGKPLKKQLDKHAQSSHPARSPRLYFGVMFYIAGAHKLVDDVARYQYYLQLKNDIVDGRLPLTVDQVIRLAAFSLQVEFADYEYDRNAGDYFTDNMVFPKNLTKDENIMSELMTEVLSAYMSLQGVHPVKAEIQYMKEIQLMDGYGMEYYVAKDEKGKELYLGTSYVGIFARYLDGQPPVFFKWTEIARLSQSKKTFEIDTSKSSVQYTMEDSDTAKYLRRMCLLQQKFYKSNKSTLSASLSDISEYPEIELPDIQQSSMPRNDIPDQLTESQTSLTFLQDQRSEQESRSASIGTDDCYRQSQQSLNTSGTDLYQGQHSQKVETSPDGVAYTVTQQQQQVVTTPQQSDPTSDPTYAARLAALPAYRQTPDYESLMQQRMAQQQSLQASHSFREHQQTLAHSQIYTQTGEGLAYSQPEIGHGVHSYNQGGSYAVGPQMYTNIFHEQNEYISYRQAGERGNVSNLVIQPTYSSPELTTQGVPQEYTPDYLNVNEASYPYHYKPPPPYPRASNSTPDLAVQTTARTNMSHSPDLVSRKTLGDSAFAAQSKLDTSVENLANVVIDERETKMDNEAPQVQVTQAETTDDTSSDHSNATFHAKESDSEPDEPFVRAIPQRQSSKSNIQVRFVAPNKAPQPSASKEVATRRESFRRMMIARSGSFTPGFAREDPKRISHKNRSLRLREKDKILEHDILDTNKTNLAKEKSNWPVHETVENLKQTKVVRAASDTNARNDPNRSSNDKLKVLHEKCVSLDSSAERLDLLEKLKSTEQEIPQTISESDSSYRTKEEMVEESDSDSDKETPGSSPMGPLKVAAMNGLTMSRPMVLALMNDESRAPKDERRKVLEAKLSENLVFKEFEDTPKRMSDIECHVAKSADNASRNRFRDVLPYDSTRVKLTPKKDNPAGYINASHVKLSVGNRVWWYIATQGPLDTTVGDFWQMVWEQEVEVIAMLTAVFELGRPKCFQYWPVDPGAENKQTFGDYEVTLLFSNDSLCYVTNRIHLCHLPTKRDKEVWHLQYTDWPDHGCPDDIYGFLGFLDEVESVQRLAESEEGSGKKSPILVHCSAGVGRTGVVILTQVMKFCLEHNHDVNLPKALNMIRQQRMHMVQTLGQYNFIHKTLIQYLKNTRLI